MSSDLVSRRAVARGAAWTVPLVAIAVAAPAFAVSPGGPPVGSLVTSCRCIGNGDFYRLNVSFTNTGTDTYTVTGTSLTSTNSGTTTYVVQQVQVPPGTSVQVFQFLRSNNTSTIQVSFTYTTTNNTTSVTDPAVTISDSVPFPNCGPGICP
jgi:hypothetical protein